MNATTVAKVPVTSNGIPIRNIWHMLIYAWRQLPLLDAWQGDVESAPTLQALLATILRNLVRQRIRIGLGRNYRIHAEEIRGVRGRIQFVESLRKLTFPNGRSFCHFQTFDQNVPKNRIIRSTLHRLAQNGDFGTNVGHSNVLRHELRQLVRDLEHISLIELKPDLVRRHELERDDHDYRLMLSICHLILQQEMPTETTGTRTTYSLDRDWKVIWRVFEEFVAQFFELRLHNWQVRAQTRIKWAAAPRSEYLPSMRPDLILHHIPTGRIVMLDTKFTRHSLTENRNKKLRFNQEHIFQLYAYVRSQEDRSDKYRSAAGVLLYPSVEHELSEQTAIQGHVFRWQTIDLRRPWQEIEASLVDLGASLAVYT